MTLPPDALLALAAGCVGAVLGSYGLVRLWVFAKSVVF